MQVRSLVATLDSASLLGACEPSFAEHGRATDPSGRLDAVWGILETDATVATPTIVFLTRAGAKPRGDHVFSADHVDGLKVKWMGADALSIGADHARVYASEREEIIRVDGRARTVRLSYDIRTQEPVSRVEDYLPRD